MAHKSNKLFYFIIILVCSASLAQAHTLAANKSESSVITKMIERGKSLMKAIPQTGIKLAGRVLDFIPTPETVFNVSKQTLIGLPQELVAYAVNKVCKCFEKGNSIYLRKKKMKAYYTETQEKSNIPASIDPRSIQM